MQAHSYRTVRQWSKEQAPPFYSVPWYVLFLCVFFSAVGRRSLMRCCFASYEVCFDLDTREYEQN